MALEQTFRVAIFDEFLDAFANIPRPQQRKVNQFVRKFRDNPTSASINYESISRFIDPNLRTVRIDLDWRAVVLKPETGNVYVLLWVAHHDAAMRWAQNKRVSIHPDTGAMQVITSGEVAPEAPVAPAGATRTPLFDQLRDRELVRLGVPQEHLTRVRAVTTPEALEELRPSLPPEAYEALFWLSEGEALDEVERAMAAAPAQVDTKDFAAALERDASRRRFVTVDNDEALAAMLGAPLDKWRVFLHPSQAQLVRRNWGGPVSVLGGAGTGKTVVAMHRAVYLAEHVFSRPTDRILFTTYTRNLAADISKNLEKLAGPETRRRIEVVHLDKFVADLLKGAGYRYEIRWWDASPHLEALWDEAVALAPSNRYPTAFYRDEWELVVQPAGCATWEEYRDASRSGRGVRLTRAQRKEIWPVFEGYRNLLERHGLREPEDAMRDAATLLERGEARTTFRAAVVDEAQDMSTHAFALLRKVVPAGPNDLFIVGDGHQRIYRKRVVLSRAGVDVRGRGRRLRINYRTTDEIRRFAVALLHGVEVADLDDGADTLRGYTSLMHGSPPEVQVHASFDEEAGAIARWLEGTDLSKACLVARTNELRDRYSAALQQRGIATCPVQRSTADDPTRPGLRVATMHRVKGLEFERVVLAGLSDELMPWRKAVDRSDDAAVRRETEEMERSLCYVAVTRAKQAALLTCHGTPSALIRPAVAT